MRRSSEQDLVSSSTLRNAGMRGLIKRFKSELTHLRNRQSLYSTGVRHMRTKTEVDERAAAVHSRGCPVRHFVVDIVLLILVVLHK